MAMKYYPMFGAGPMNFRYPVFLFTTNLQQAVAIIMQLIGNAHQHQITNNDIYFR